MVLVECRRVGDAMRGQIKVVGSSVRLSGPARAELPLTEQVRADWDAWSSTYRDAVSSGDPTSLISVGRELFAWLDTTGWATTWHAATGPRELEIAADLPETADQSALLSLPWELLAKDVEHLAADRIQPYVVWRRLGAETAVEAPTNRDLSLLFMAASPESTGSGFRLSELAYEAEEVAILDATRSVQINLAVEESGCVDFLRDRMTGVEEFDVLHLSCHGTVLSPEHAERYAAHHGEPGPTLLLESPVGDIDFVSPERLAEAWGARPPALLFLSACRTAESPGEAVESYARKAARAVPVVLGWDGSVFDQDAIVFAARLYDELARFNTPMFAAASARRHLLVEHLKDQERGQHWHLARVWCGPTGGQPLCARSGTARPIATNRGDKSFLDNARKRVPVATTETFVGRRRETQRVLRAFRDNQDAGVFIHGMGNLGKSSLAARVANRVGCLTVVIYEDYDPVKVLEQLGAAVPEDQREGLDKWRERVDRRPEALVDAVESMLNGPFRQTPGPCDRR